MMRNATKIELFVSFAIFVTITFITTDAFSVDTHTLFPSTRKKSFVIFPTSTSISMGGGDSYHACEPPNSELLNFKKDIESLLDIKGNVDSSLPGGFKRGTKLAYYYIWDNEMWDKYRSCWRYIRYLRTFFFYRSRLFRFIFPQLLSYTIWSGLCACYQHTHHVGIAMLPSTVSGSVASIQQFRIPLTALSLLSSFVAVLLTVRTNQCLSRVAEGRLAWQRCNLLSRNISQLVSYYVYPVNRSLGILANRHLSLYAWLLKSRLREEDSENEAVRVMLSNEDANYLLSQGNKPIAVITKLRQITSYLIRRGDIGEIIGNRIEEDLLELSRVCGVCDRIKGSPIPPSYTSHTCRLLSFYLFFLPFALEATGLPPLVTVIASLAVGWVMLGLDEISHQIEEPFRIMPMHPCARAATQDVADSILCLPASLPVTDDDGDE